MLRRLLTSSSPRACNLNPNSSPPNTRIPSYASTTYTACLLPSTIDDDAALPGTGLLDLIAANSGRPPCPLVDAGILRSWMVKTGSYEDDLFLCNTLINAYAKSGELGLAQEVFDGMTLRNSVTWACLISGLVRNSAPEEACSVFRDMVREGWEPSRYVFGSVIKACNEKGSDGSAFGLQVHGMVVKTPCSVDYVVSNALISMYGRSLGSPDDALCAFDEIKFKNSISWNSIISVFSQREDVVSAFQLFSCMQKEGGGQSSLEPNEYTFGSLITAAGSSPDNGEKLLKQMLARVNKSGFVDNLYVGSALVSALARFGLADYATEIFWQLSVRNVVSMNGLMVGLVRQKAGKETLQIFMETRGSVDVSVDSYLILLSAFAEFTDPEEGKRKGREIHAYLVRNELINRGVSVGNALVNMYAKCGAVSDATSVFVSMTEKDLISWNSLVTGLDQNECFEDAVMSFRQMRRSGLVPANYTLISALSSCASLRWNLLGSQIHAEGTKLGLDLDCSVANALLALYSDTGHISNCQELFSSMLEHDQISWNSIIGAIAHSDESVLEALYYFMSMLRAGWRPSNLTFLNLFAAVSSISDAALNRQVHALVVKHNLAHDSAIENALLTCYGKCGEMDECERIFTRMSGRRDEVSWNAMISGYIHNEFLSKAMDLVWSMLQRGQRLDAFTFATILSACASVATLERGMEIHACGIRANLESDVVVGSALIDMYSKCGRVDYASRFFSGMPQRNVYSWNSMISGFARHGLGDEALKLFASMKLTEQQPDHVTFVGVLSACSHVGMVEEGFDHFKSMQKEYGLAPRTEHYSCMVDLLGRAGELAKMEDFIDKMPIGPSILIWRTVLAACCRANGRNSELGRKAANMLLEMEPRNAVNYVLLSNMYASGGNWVDMGKARTAMNRAAAKKEAGCSWVTMKDGVHVFVAGDRSHPDKEQIYAKLREVNRKMTDAGYVPLTGFALYDLDTESKEELLSYHSEKIAVAFVLTRNSEMPIRIMKNLRICGDCHSAFKYISKIVNRTIVLRDSNRFHHFEEGACSCRDYW